MYKKIASGILTILFIYSYSFGAKIEVFTADNIVQLVKERISKTKTFVGSFVYAYNQKTYWGVIKFKAPNKFLMSYMDKGTGGNYETGQKFMTDGKNLWLVFKSQNIAINETLEKNKSPLVGWNITRLLKDYVPQLPKTGYKVQYEKKLAYKLTFIPKSSTAGFKSINLIVNEDGDILKVEALNQLGLTIELGITYNSFNEPVADQDFTYEPDELTQIFQNILLPKNQDDSAQ